VAWPSRPCSAVRLRALGDAERIVAHAGDASFLADDRKAMFLRQVEEFASRV
jgi:hypothetical protein